jgi:hypothetical protein
MSLWSAGEVRMTELVSTAHSMPRAMARYWSKGEVGRLDFDVVLAPRRRKETGNGSTGSGNGGSAGTAWSRTPPAPRCGNWRPLPDLGRCR